jgi:drug/metabolite transporter (DMT)-like permease
VLLVVGLGLLAAFLFAGSASLQQHAAQGSDYAPEVGESARRRGRPVVLPALFTLVRGLVRKPLWLFGWLTNLIGFLVQATALHFGSVALVQPLLVTQLLFALPMASAWCRRWPTLRDWLSGLAICGGLAVFLAVRGVAPMQGGPDRGRVVMAGLSIVVVVGVLMVVSAGRRPLVHSTLIAVAAGLCFAMSAVLMKLTAADLIGRGVAATARDWVGYALAVSTLTGLLLEQGAFAAGSLSAAIAAMTITNPLASYLLGVLAFHVMPPTGAGVLAALAGAGALLFAGAVGLAHSPIVRTDTTSEPGLAAGAPTASRGSPITGRSSVTGHSS